MNSAFTSPVTPIFLNQHSIFPSTNPRRPRFLHSQRPTYANLTPNSDDTNSENTQLQGLQSNNQLQQIRILLSLEQEAPETAAALIHKSGVLNSKNQQVRLTALATLGKLGLKSEVSVLKSILQSDSDHANRAAAANALGSLLENLNAVKKDTEIIIGIEALVQAAKEDEHFIVRYAAIVGIGNAGNDMAVSTLLPIAENIAAPALEAAAAVRALGEVLDVLNVNGNILETVRTRAADREDLVRAAVARTLGEWRSIPEASVSLQEMKRNEDKYGQSNLVQTILDDILG